PSTVKTELDPPSGHSKKKSSEKPELVKTSAEVDVPENAPTKKQPTKFNPVKALPGKEPANQQSEETKPTSNDAMNAPSTKPSVENSRTEKVRSAKSDSAKASVVKESKSNPQSERAWTAKVEGTKTVATNEPAKADSANAPSTTEPVVSLQLSDKSMETG